MRTSQLSAKLGCLRCIFNFHYLILALRSALCMRITSCDGVELASVRFSIVALPLWLPVPTHDSRAPGSHQRVLTRWWVAAGWRASRMEWQILLILYGHILYVTTGRYK